MPKGCKGGRSRVDTPTRQVSGRAPPPLAMALVWPGVAAGRRVSVAQGPHRPPPRGTVSWEHKH